MTQGELKRIEERICSEISLLLSKNAGASNVDVEMSAYTIECRNPGSNETIGYEYDHCILVHCGPSAIIRFENLAEMKKFAEKMLASVDEIKAYYPEV